MEKVRLDKHSLKQQFAVINHCFREVNSILTGVLANNTISIDVNFKNDIDSKLGDINSMANVFRCYALRRIEYYYNEREYAIFNLQSVSQWVFDWSRLRAVDHLRSVDKECAGIASDQH